jgi:membrane dipeptidase
MLRQAAAGGLVVGLGARTAGATAAPRPGPAPQPSGRIVVSGLDVSTLSERYVTLLRKGGVDCWHKSTYGPVAMGEVLGFADAHPRDIRAVRSVAEIRRAKADGVVSIVFGTQSVDGVPPATLRQELRGNYEMGLRIVGIAYNLPNPYGSGNFYPYIGLTAAGRRLVEAIHGLKMILDVGGHTGEQTSLDAIALAPEMPVMCSHTNVAAIADNPRCISDRLIDGIARTGGVIGLTAVNDFHVRGRNQLDVAHSPRVGLDAHVDQMDYLKKRVGVDHIGIGPDFVEDRNIDYDVQNRTTSINRAIISDGPWLYVQGFENISELPNVEQAMARRGWSQADIDKVLGGNWLRLYQKAWGA